MAVRPGCRCQHCWTLREHMLELTGNDYGLTPAVGCADDTVTLRVLTTGPAPDNLVELIDRRCDQTMTCQCDDCTTERARRVRAGVRDTDGGIPIKRRRAA